MKGGLRVALFFTYKIKYKYRIKDHAKIRNFATVVKLLIFQVVYEQAMVQHPTKV